MHRVVKTWDSGLKDPDGKSIILKFNDKEINTIDSGFGFFISQLAYLEAKVYESKYRKIVYPEFVPVDTSAPEWIDQVDYISYDSVGVSGFTSENAADAQEVTLQTSKSTIPVFYGKNAYSYSLRELQKSQQLKLPLDSTKAQKAYRAFEEGAQRVAFKGDAARGITGLFNNAAIVTAKETSTLNWATATGQQIVTDMNNMLIKVYQESSQTHLPNRLVLPFKRFAYISNTQMTDLVNKTILEYFKENNLYTAITNEPLDIKQNLEIQTAGAEAGGDRMMAYELNDENLTMQMPMPWKSLAPEVEGTRIKVISQYVYGGVEFRYEKSAAYTDFTIAPPGP